MMILQILSGFIKCPFINPLTKEMYTASDGHAQTETNFFKAL